MPFPGDVLRCPSGFRSALAAGRHTGFTSGGQSRSFELRLPAATFTGPRPLVFVFHGTNLSGSIALTEYGLSNWLTAGAIVVAPDANGNGYPWPVWDSTQFPTRPPAPNADLALFDDLLFCVSGHHPVDARRIYVLGHSAGGAATNFFLGHRASVLAGGIAASGGVEFTQPSTPSTDPLTVLVTWGGSNDCYTGSTGGISVSSCFEEQSALATSFWANRPNTVEVNCRGNQVGHVWLSSLDAWMPSLMLSRPKGVSAAGFTVPTLPSNANATCTRTPFTYQPPAMVTCGASTTTGCQAYCQMMGDCLAENGSLGPSTAPQLLALGFQNSANICGGCLTTCQNDAQQGGAADTQVLSCLATNGPTTACGPGFAGARAFQTMATCCGQVAASSQVCQRFCTAFRMNQVLASYFPWCP